MARSRWPRSSTSPLSLADALDSAHARGLIHRDLKPANIFLTTRGQPKILDFGLAKMVGGTDGMTLEADGLTGPAAVIGTLAYMSPEQLRGEPLDGRTDLFSLGLVLYEMATGQRAFTGSTSAVVSAAILGQEPAAPRALRADLPARLEEAILKLLEKDRLVRCQSAAELRADLMRVKRQMQLGERTGVRVRRIERRSSPRRFLTRRSRDRNGGVSVI